MCIAHNTTRFQSSTYDLRGCEHCLYILSTYNEGSKDVFNASLNAMRRSFKYAFNSNKEKLSAEAIVTYENSDGKMSLLLKLNTWTLALEVRPHHLLLWPG